jgi:hypothetical protein
MVSVGVGHDVAHDARRTTSVVRPPILSRGMRKSDPGVSGWGEASCPRRATGDGRRAMGDGRWATARLFAWTGADLTLFIGTHSTAPLHIGMDAPVSVRLCRYGSVLVPAGRGAAPLVHLNGGGAQPVHLFWCVIGQDDRRRPPCAETSAHQYKFRGGVRTPVHMQVCGRLCALPVVGGWWLVGGGWWAAACRRWLTADAWWVVWSGRLSCGRGPPRRSGPRPGRPW